MASNNLNKNPQTHQEIAASIIQQDRSARGKLNSGGFPTNNDRQNKCAQKLQKLFSQKTIPIREIQQEAWNGIPHSIRATTWQFLINSPNHNSESRKNDYWRMVNQYFHKHVNLKSIHHQIMVDIPRTKIPIEGTEQILERILFLWAVRHPGSGYVQGINDLAVPFICVYSKEGVDFEAETFWSLTKLTEGIQDYYTPGQPGIFRSLKMIENIIEKTDSRLFLKLSSLDIDFSLFAFRWINNLLLRELPLRCGIRLFDTYLCELDRLPKFHSYVCAELLRFFSEKIQEHYDFQSLMLFLQNLPTSDWDDSVVDDLLARAFCAMSAFENNLFQ